MKRARLLILRTLSVVIIGLLLVQTGAAGQSPAGLAIQVLQANERENLTDRELPPLKVRVMDRTGRVIPEASVSFSAPEDGPTGYFLPDSSRVTVTTDTQGIATAPRFRTNSKVGEYQIEVVASYRDSISRTAIPRTNLFKLKSSNRKYIVLSAVIGGAAAAAFVSRRSGPGPVTSALGALTPTVTIGGSSSAPIPLTLAPVTNPSGDTLSPAPATSSTSSTTVATSSGSTATSPSSGTAVPTTVTQPAAPSPCAGQPPKSNKSSCR